MELFTIQCTTCKARLVVKDESVIGDILSCPKCKSMVHVVPPVGWKGPGSGDSSPGEVPAAVSAAAEPAAPPSEPRPVKPAIRKVAAAAIPPALPPRSPPVFADAAPTLFAMAVARAQRDWILLSSGLLGGVALGAAVWLVVAMQSPAPVVADAPLGDASSVEQAPEPTEGPGAKNSQSLGPPAEAPRQAASAATAAMQVSTESAAATSTRAAPEAADPPSPAPAAAEQAPDAQPRKPGPSLKLEPIRSPLKLAGGAAGPADSDAHLTPESASSPGTSAEPVPLDGEPADAAGIRDAALEPSPLKREEIDERLSISLAQVEFTDVSLAQFAAFIADVASVPVRLDEAALAKSGKGGRTPITVKLSDTTPGEALRAAVERIGLSVTLGDGQIVVTAAKQ